MNSAMDNFVNIILFVMSGGIMVYPIVVFILYIHTSISKKFVIVSSGISLGLSSWLIIFGLENDFVMATCVSVPVAIISSLFTKLIVRFKAN